MRIFGQGLTLDRSSPPCTPPFPPNETGVQFALVQAPMAKFFSTAANDGMQALLSDEAWGVGTQTFLASAVVGCFRILLMPIDTFKTVLQVDGKQGYRSLLRSVKKGNVAVLYQGAIANSIASAMSNFPW